MHFDRSYGVRHSLLSEVSVQKQPWEAGAPLTITGAILDTVTVPAGRASARPRGKSAAQAVAGKDRKSPTPAGAAGAAAASIQPLGRLRFES